jgi:hypothetical protein
VDDVATVAEIYLGYEAFVLCRHFLCMGGAAAAAAAAASNSIYIDPDKIHQKFLSLPMHRK